jgi:hypothetical protein
MQIRLRLTATVHSEAGKRGWKEGWKKGWKKGQGWKKGHSSYSSQKERNKMNIPFSGPQKERNKMNVPFSGPPNRIAMSPFPNSFPN